MIEFNEEALQKEARQRMLDAGIYITDEEEKKTAVRDFGLGRFEEIGLACLTYVNTDRVCSKEMVLWPWQICPEHRHPYINGKKGKQEIFRVRGGEMYLYVPGEKTPDAKCRIPKGKEDTFTVFHQIILKKGDMYVLDDDTLHWFQGGPEGVVVSEFSTAAVDQLDLFTDEDIGRDDDFLKLEYKLPE